MEKYVYRFALFGLLTGFVGVFIRWVLVFHEPSSVLQRVGTTFAVVLTFSLAWLLWRRPAVLSFVVKLVYFFGTASIAIRLVYFFYVDPRARYGEFDQVAPWMAVNYLLPFIIFGPRVGTILSSAVLGIWVILSAIFEVIHFGKPPADPSIGVFIQTYLAQSILIVFMAFSSKLQTMYLALHKSGEHLEKMAKTDFLLGTPNRRAVQEQLLHHMNQSMAQQTPLSVVMMDIDRFKQINDNYGHDIGDAVLIEISRVMQGYVVEPCSFGRWGGEEFVVVLPEFVAVESVQFAQQLRKVLEIHRFRPVGTVTASFGVTEYRPGDTVESLLRRADEALYKSKALGRNRVEAS